MKYFIGIDSGGTSTRLVIATEEGEVVGFGTAGASNPNSVGVKRAAEAIVHAYRGAISTVGLNTDKFCAGFLGMAGVVGGRDLEVAREVLTTAGLEMTKFQIDHDIRIALAGGLGADEGIALIVGTGSSCYGRNATGQTWQAGGWGNLIDDLGSAHHLGHAALCVAVRVADGREADGQGRLLLEGVMQALRLSEIRDLIERLYRTGMDKSEVAALAPVTLSAWRARDPIAARIVRLAATELARCVQTVARELSMPTPQICYTGGLIENNPDYLQVVTTEIHRRLPHARVSESQLPPVLGAVLLAMKSAGNALSSGVQTRLSETFNSASSLSD